MNSSTVVKRDIYLIALLISYYNDKAFTLKSQSRIAYCIVFGILLCCFSLRMIWYKSPSAIETVNGRNCNITEIITFLHAGITEQSVSQPQVRFRLSELGLITSGLPDWFFFRDFGEKFSSCRRFRET